MYKNKKHTEQKEQGVFDEESIIVCYISLFIKP